jgi:integrase
VDQETGRSLGKGCPQLLDPDHGSWYFKCTLTEVFGTSRVVRRGGFATPEAAAKERSKVLAESRRRHATGCSVAECLRQWLSVSEQRVRPNTLRAYATHIDRYLIPHLGHLPLTKLAPGHVSTMLTELAHTTSKHDQPLSATTVRRIWATLRAALSWAVRAGLIERNAAKLVQMPREPARPPQVWTEELVAEWNATGRRPLVAVWTLVQLRRFLDLVRDDRLFALWWLFALRGLRRGEAAGLRWVDVSLEERALRIVQQRITVGATVQIGEPKTRSGRRSIALDRRTVEVLRLHRERQLAEAAAAGGRWRHSGYVFTKLDGDPLHPNFMTHRFADLLIGSGLPPIRLHDLRHGAATLAHHAGVDLKTVQDLLGHASYQLTADTYTNVLPETQQHAADAVADLILDRHDRDQQRDTKGVSADSPTGCGVGGGDPPACSHRSLANRAWSGHLGRMWRLGRRLRPRRRQHHSDRRTTTRPTTSARSIGP